MAPSWTYRLLLHGGVEHECRVTLAGNTLEWRVEPVDENDEDGEKSACDQEVADFRKFGPPEAPEFLRAPEETMDALCAAAGVRNAPWRKPLPEGVTKFFRAAEKNDTDTMSELLRAGVDVNARDHNGRTSLWHAAESHTLDTSEWLLERGADLNVQDRYGRTVLMAAASRNQERHADFYRLKGADLTVRDDTGRTAWLHGVEAKSAGTFVSLLRACPEQDWPRALHIAASRSHIEWMDGEDWFVEIWHPEMNPRQGHFQWTPLQACLQGYKPLSQAAQWLVGNGADLMVIDEKDGGTILHLAAANNFPWMVPDCIRAGVDPNARNRDDHTALSLALERNESPRLVKALLAAGADGLAEVPCQPRGQALEMVSCEEKAKRMGLIWSRWLIGSSPQDRAAWPGLCCYARLSPEGVPEEEDGDPPPGSIWLEFSAEWCGQAEVETQLLEAARKIKPDAVFAPPYLLSQEEALKQPAGWPKRQLWAVFPDGTFALVDRFRDERPREMISDPAAWRNRLSALRREWSWQDQGWKGDWTKFQVTLRGGTLRWKGDNSLAEQGVERFRMEGPPRGAGFHRSFPGNALDELCALLGETARPWERWRPRKEWTEQLEEWKKAHPAMPPPLPAPEPPPHQSGRWCYARMDIEDHFTTPSGAGSDGEWSCWMEFPAEWCYGNPQHLEQWLGAALKRAYQAMNEKATSGSDGGHYSLNRHWSEVLTRAEALKQPWTAKGKVLYSFDERAIPPVSVPDEEKHRQILAMADPSDPPQPIPISPPPFNPPKLPINP